MGQVRERKYNWKNYGHKGRVKSFASILILSFLILFLVAVSARLVFTIRDSMVESVSVFVTDTPPPLSWGAIYTFRKVRPSTEVELLSSFCA